MEFKYKKTKAACYIGYTVQAIINNFLPILFIIFNKNYGLSYESIGRLIFINFITQIFADISAPLIVKRIGYKKSAVLCHFLATAGLLLLSFLPNVIGNTYFAIVISIMVYAFGSGIIEVIISPIMEFLPTENKSGNMAVLHSFYCWGQVFTIAVTTLAVKVLGFGDWQLIPLFWAVVPFINMFFFMSVPVVEKTEEEKSGGNNYFKDKRFYYIVIFMICSGASEIAMSQWASIFAQNGLGISKIKGDFLGPCIFGVLMGTGRILYAMFSNKFSYLKTVAFCSFLALVCYLVAGFSKNPVVSLAACAFCGITVSMFWPGTLSFAVKTFPSGGALMFGIVALSGDLGCSTGPWLLGLIADRVNLNTGFAVCGIFPLVMLIMAFLFSIKKD